MTTLMANTLWAADKSDRIVRLVGFRLSNLFIFKCLMKENKKITVSILLFTVLLFFSIVLTVVESPLFYHDAVDDGRKVFIYPTFAIWNVFVTLFTIGYGDLAVATYLGRIFVSILTILSGIIIAFITVAMTSDFEFEDQDRSAFTLVKSVKMKDEVSQLAAIVL